MSTLNGQQPTRAGRHSNIPLPNQSNKIFTFRGNRSPTACSSSPKGHIYQEIMEPKIIGDGRQSNNILLFQTQPNFNGAASGYSGKSPSHAFDSTGSGSKYNNQIRHPNLFYTSTGEQMSSNYHTARSPRTGNSRDNHQLSDAQRSSIDAQSQSLMSVSKHLMPPGGDASIDDYKSELKQCLRENITHKREIKNLRKWKKEAEDRQKEM